MKNVMLCFFVFLPWINHAQFEYVDLNNYDESSLGFYVKDDLYYEKGTDELISGDILYIEYTDSVHIINTEVIDGGVLHETKEKLVLSSVIESTISFQDLVVKKEQLVIEEKNIFENLKLKLNELNEELEYADTLNDLEVQILQTDIEKCEYDLEQLNKASKVQMNVLNIRYEKLIEMYEEVIAEVAENYGSNVIFNEQRSGLVLESTGEDVTEQVKEKLLKMDKKNPAHRNNW